MQEKFFENKKAIIVLIAGSLVVLVAMGIRQTWGLFYQFFDSDLGINRTQFGLAIGVQMLFWGITAPLFGMIADKYGSNRAAFVAFVFYIIGSYIVINQPASNSILAPMASKAFKWRSTGRAPIAQPPGIETFAL